MLIDLSGPVLDPVEFVNRYFSASVPCASAMGTQGAILRHVLYAWALSYGVNEKGQLDLQEGGEAPDGPTDLAVCGPGEIKREGDRQMRKEKLKEALEVILKEIDEGGICREPSWDGVRSLLLILPLTEREPVVKPSLALMRAEQSYLTTCRASTNV